MHIDYLSLTIDLVSVGGIGFDPLPAPFSLHSYFLVWCHLRPSGVMPRCLVVSIPCRIDAQVPHHYIFFSHPYRFGDRHVSIPDRAIPLAALATLTDLSYQKRAMPASLSFHRLPYPATHSLDKYGFFRTLDDDVVVTSVFRSTITKSVLASMSVQLQPVLSPCLV
jgi:hypothetical protein